MNQTLAEHHRRIASGIDEIRAFCSQPEPNVAALSDARVRLSRASGARTQYVNETLIPELRARADRSMLAELAELQRMIAAKRMASSVHVSVWSSKAIAGDWRGYCQAARSIWAMMEEQMSRERRIFGSL